MPPITTLRWRHVGMKLRSRMKRAKLLSRCRPNVWWMRFVPSEFLGLDVEEFCDRHALNYLIGGKEADRLKADWQLYEAVHCHAIWLTMTPWKRWLRPLYAFTAWAYYRVVRSGGAPHFFYGWPRDREAIMLLLVRAERDQA